MADDTNKPVELMADMLHEQREMRREFSEEIRGMKQAFNTGFLHLADKITEMKSEVSEIKDDVRSIDRRMARFEDEQLLPRLLDLEHRLSIVERKVA